MSKLAAVAERIAQTRRWLDQEADRLAARLDQIEKRAPAAIQNAHRLLDGQQRDLDAIEQMVQQWLSATADASSKLRTAQHAAVPPGRAQFKQPTDAPASFDPAHYLLDEQQKEVGRLERALQTLATDAPEPDVATASEPVAAQHAARHEAAASVDSRRLLGEEHKDEGGLERALQTLANRMAPQPPSQQPANAGQPAAAHPQARPRLTQASEAMAVAEDAAKQQPRKLGVVRVA